MGQLAQQYGAHSVLYVLAEIVGVTDYDLINIQKRLKGAKAQKKPEPSKKAERSRTTLVFDVAVKLAFNQAARAERMQEVKYSHGALSLAFEAALILYLALSIEERAKIIADWHKDNPLASRKVKTTVMANLSLMALFEKKLLEEHFKTGGTTLIGFKSRGYENAMILYLAIAKEYREGIINAWHSQNKEVGLDD